MNNLKLTTPASELQDRIAGLQKKLESSEIDGALIVQKTDVFISAVPLNRGGCMFR